MFNLIPIIETTRTVVTLLTTSSFPGPVFDLTRKYNLSNLTKQTRWNKNCGRTLAKIDRRLGDELGSDVGCSVEEPGCERALARTVL